MKKAPYDATFSPFRGFTRDEWKNWKSILCFLFQTSIYLN